MPSPSQIDFLTVIALLQRNAPRYAKRRSGYYLANQLLDWTKTDRDKIPNDTEWQARVQKLRKDVADIEYYIGPLEPASPESIKSADPLDLLVYLLKQQKDQPSYRQNFLWIDFHPTMEAATALLEKKCGEVVENWGLLAQHQDRVFFAQKFRMNPAKVSWYAQIPKETAELLAVNQNADSLMSMIQQLRRDFGDAWCADDAKPVKFNTFRRILKEFIPPKNPY